MVELLEEGEKSIRLYINVDSGNQPRFHLPWNYHLSVIATIYDALNRYEPEIATEFHQSPHAPPFSVSEFVQTGPYQTNDDGLSCERGYWILNSDDTRIVDAVANYARHQEFEVGHTTVPVESVELDTIEGVTDARYRTLSPIYVSQYRDDRREDLFPSDGMWYARLQQNVTDRMEAMREETVDQFSIDEVHWSKEKRLRVGDGWCSATRMELSIRADEQTSTFIQEQGLGERTGMGFGCVVPVDHIPAEWR